MIFQFEYENEEDEGDVSLYDSDVLYQWLLIKSHKKAQSEEILVNGFKTTAVGLQSSKSTHEIAQQLLAILTEAIQWKYTKNLFEFVTTILTDSGKDEETEKLLRFVQYFWWRLLKGEAVQFPYK